MFTKKIENLGLFIIQSFEELGKIFILFARFTVAIFYKNFPFKNLIRQIYFIGFKSLGVIAFTSFFMGMVIAFSTGVYLNTKITGVAAYTGGAIAVAFIREIGPILTALLLAGKSGSAVAAEIGSMVVTEQVDALVTMGVRPVQYLLVPRILAGAFAFPILTLISDAMGIVGGSFVANAYLNQSFQAYFINASSMINIESVLLGFVKSIAFGILVIFISCSRGYFVKGGTESVGTATTDAVVISSLFTVVADYVITLFAS